jgi:hypothetical protein
VVLAWVGTLPSGRENRLGGVSEKPRAAEERPGGTWGSVLTSQELAAVGSVGFAPVGQVFGAAVYAAGAASGSSCPAGGC